MKEKIINLIPWLGVGVIIYLMAITVSDIIDKPEPILNDTATTVIEERCIIFIKDYTKYKDLIDPAYIIPNYDPEGYLIDTCKGKTTF